MRNGLSKLLLHYTQKGDEEMAGLIKKVSTLAWLNVNLNGTYSFSFDNNMINIDELLKPLMLFLKVGGWEATPTVSRSVLS
ncbi:MAG: hypothetical protein ACJAUP_001855 [Cellvibrionaceae bacterium]